LTGAQAVERGCRGTSFGGLHEAVMRAKAELKLDPNADASRWFTRRARSPQIAEMFGQVHARAEAPRPLAKVCRPMERWPEVAAERKTRVAAVLDRHPVRALPG
jgi:hypothetical protein